MPYPTLSDRITEFIKYQLPAFIREDHSLFVDFCQAYYEWLETKYKGDVNALYGAKKLLDQADIDKTPDEFLVYFAKEFLVHIPDSVLCDRRKLTKNIKEYYRSRGCEKSFNLLFRIMFLDKTGFYYPTTDILRPDSGTWVQKKSIRCMKPNVVSPFNINLEFVGKKVFGRKSGASGVIDYIISYETPGGMLYDIIFKKGTIYGEFRPWELIATSNSSINTLQIQPILIRVELNEGGEDYTLADRITVTNPYDIKMGVSIKEIDPNGKILDLTITNPSFGYPDYPITDVENIPKIVFSGGTGAIATAFVGALLEHPGYYVTSDGFLNTVEKLRDDYYYQEYSYVIKSHTNKTEWDDLVHRLLHPAGMIVFGILNIQPDAVYIGPHSTDRPQITIKSFPEAVSVFKGIPEHSANIRLQISDREEQARTRIGSTLHSIDRDAYRNVPTQLVESNLILDDETYAHYSLSDLGNIRLDGLLAGTDKTIVQPRMGVTVGHGYNLRGTIRFNGVGIPNITVNLTGPQTATTTTNDFGEYFFTQLLPGEYTITPEDENWDFV